MPIRNFYIDCKIDGRKSRLTGGPRAKDGGFNLTIYQQSEGKKVMMLRVTGGVTISGKLSLDIWTPESALPVTSTTVRLLPER